MKKIIVFLWVLCSVMWMNSSIAAVNTGSPVEMVQSLADEVIANLEAHQATLKETPELVYTLANKVIIPHTDLDEMSQRVLPPQLWDKASASQRDQFKKEFTQLLVRTYASALANYTDQTMRFFPMRKGMEKKNMVVVNSQIVRSDAPPMAVSYRVVMKGNEWKLYDMIVEGVSLLLNFQEQFRQKVSQGKTMDELIQDLKQHQNQKNTGRRS